MPALDAVHRLKADWRAVVNTSPLRNRNLALLMVSPTAGPKASVLEGAARELGARVANVCFIEPHESEHDELAALARLLGRMYDAIDCGTLASTSVDLIKVESGIATYKGLGLDDHPAKALGDLITLCDQRNPSEHPSSIRFQGDRETRRARAFLTAASDVGFRVLAEEGAKPSSSEATFVVDAMDPLHWSLHEHANPVDEAHLSANHRLVIQTVLLGTIVSH